MSFFHGAILNGRFKGNADIQTWSIDGKQVAANGQQQTIQPTFSFKPIVGSRKLTIFSTTPLVLKWLTTIANWSTQDEV